MTRGKHVVSFSMPNYHVLKWKSETFFLSSRNIERDNTSVTKIVMNHKSSRVLMLQLFSAVLLKIGTLNHNFENIAHYIQDFINSAT